MAARVQTVAFQGIEAVPVDVQVQVTPGLPRLIIVGLPDKAISEAGERVRAALVASGLSLPPSASSSISRRQTSPRRAATTISPSRWR